jgi:four helix bundle protein
VLADDDRARALFERLTPNAQRLTLNVERRITRAESPKLNTMAERYDLEDRLPDFSVRVIRVTESMQRSRAGTYVAYQLLRSATSPYGHHGEAEGAESRDDFIHKLRVCYKELREARRWLRLVHRAPMVAKPGLLESVLTEAGELVLIFAASIRTAESNRPAGRAKRLTPNV